MLLIDLTDKIGEMTIGEIAMSLILFMLIVLLFVVRFLTIASRNCDRHLYPTKWQVKQASASQLAEWVINLPMAADVTEAHIMSLIVKRHFELERNNDKAFAEPQPQTEAN